MGLTLLIAEVDWNRVFVSNQPMMPGFIHRRLAKGAAKPSILRNSARMPGADNGEQEILLALSLVGLLVGDIHGIVAHFSLRYGLASPWPSPGVFEPYEDFILPLGFSRHHI